MGLLLRLALGLVLASLFYGLSWPQPMSAAWRWLPCRAAGVLCAEYVVTGQCDRERDIRAGFERNFASMEETANGAMVAVMRGTELTCELYGYQKAGVRVDEKSLQVVFSTTKVVSSLACAMLVDRGLLSYDEPIAAKWPLFARNGKQNITLRHLMQHRAGLAWLCDRDPTTDDTLHLFRVETDDYLEQIKDQIERSFPNYPKGSETGYHGMTRDLVLNELVRRVTNKTLGQFIETEISQPLGIEFYVGLPHRHEHRVVEVRGASVGFALLYVWKLAWRYVTGSFRVGGPQDTTAMVKEFVELGFEMPLIRATRAVGVPVHKILDVHNSRIGRARESPSSNGVSNAKSLAVIGAVLSGALKTSILSEEGRKAAMKLESAPVYDAVTKSHVQFTACGVGFFSEALWGKAMGGLYGWHGLGGQLLLFGERGTFVYLTSSFGMQPPWADRRSIDLIRMFQQK